MGIDRKYQEAVGSGVVGDLSSGPSGSADVEGAAGTCWNPTVFLAGF